MADVTPPPVQVPQGCLCVTTYGQITHETVQTLLGCARHNDAQGLTPITYEMVPGALVAKARNDAVRNLLRGQGQWLCFLDGDMVAEPDFLLKLLVAAYGTHAHFDVVGGYCNLRGDLALPTMDTGTGTWESHFPGAGVVEVMRTGGACLLVKRHVFERLPEPWFGTRSPIRALDALQEVDTFARTKLDGQNPLQGEVWESLLRCAVEDPSADPQRWTAYEVGEDSNFADKVTAAGMRLAVHTDVVLGHVDRKVVTWRDHRDALEKRQENHRRLYGVVG